MMTQRPDSIAPVGGVAPDDERATPRASAIGSVRRESQGIYRQAWRRFRRNTMSMVALVVLAIIVVFVLSAPLISDWTGYTYDRNVLRDQLKPPFTDGHVLGTDAVGRDVLVRLAYGGRVSLRVAAIAATLTLAIGTIVGTVAGYFGGILDNVLMRFVDVLISIPGLSLLILISVLYRPGPSGLGVVLALLGWAGLARLVRAEVLSLRTRDFVHAATIVGASNVRIMSRHILPSVVPILVIWISLAIPVLILAEASLSFLGFGVRIPVPSWGNMLEVAKDYYSRSWTNVFIPGFAIYLTVLAINLVGNGLRDALDPRIGD
jgi:peptide/nickel transport system permease protein